MADKPTPVTTPEESSNLSSRKLELEIEELRFSNTWLARILSIAPSSAILITALVGIFGLWNEVAKYRAGQEQDRLIRIQNQIRGNLDQLLLYPKDDKQTVAKAVFLFEDLKRILDNPFDERRKVSDIFPNEREKISNSLSQLIQLDCDFDKSRDVGFDIAALSNYEDYKDYLKNNPEEHSYIFYKYTESLLHLHNKVSPFMENVVFSKEKRKYQYNGPITPDQFNHFEDLVVGLRRHLELIDQKSQDRIIQEFQAVTCNPNLTESLFGKKFDEKSFDEDMRNLFEEYCSKKSGVKLARASK